MRLFCKNTKIYFTPKFLFESRQFTNSILHSSSVKKLRKTKPLDFLTQEFANYKESFSEESFISDFLKKSINIGQIDSKNNLMLSKILEEIQTNYIKDLSLQSLIQFYIISEKNGYTQNIYHDDILQLIQNSLKRENLMQSYIDILKLIKHSIDVGNKTEIHEPLIPIILDQISDERKFPKELQSLFSSSVSFIQDSFPNLFNENSKYFKLIERINLAKLKEDSSIPAYIEHLKNLNELSQESSLPAFNLSEIDTIFDELISKKSQILPDIILILVK